MTEENGLPKLPRLFAQIWGQLMREGRFQSAAMVAMLAHALSHEKNDDELKSGSIALMYKAVDELRDLERKSEDTKGNTEAACSFCGLGSPEVRLVGGANAFICNECVATIGCILDTEEKPRDRD